jgi:hypothetical protein
MSPLIRASHFCRPSCKTYKVRFSQHASSFLSTDEEDLTQVSFASWRTLRALSLVTGSLVLLSSSKGRSVAVRLKHIHEDGDDDRIAEEDEEAGIAINVLTATNLGLASSDVKCCTRSCRDDDDDDDDDGDTFRYLELSLLEETALSPADTVTLRVWARPAILDGEEQTNNSWPLPPVGTLLQPQRLIAVQSKKKVYFYEIAGHNKQGVVVWEGTSSTRYRIDTQNPAVRCPRLPPFAQTRRLLLPSDDILPPHPDLPLLRQLLSSSMSAKEECVWHVCGTDAEHGLTTAVRAAADGVGRQCVVVSGLAWYAYRTSFNRTPNGMLEDKLLGLEAALDEAVRQSPCVLLLQDVDSELSGHDDKPVREDEENRIWSLLMDKVVVSKQQQQQSTVPPVLVLFASRKPLTPGPLARNMVFDSIPLSVPDARYLRYLWNKETTTTTTPMLEPRMEPLLKGRGVAEIIRIRDELCWQLARASGSSTVGGVDPLVVVQDVCTQCDALRRQTSGRIPCVKWEDVGGLSHVRQEIMDALELPLKYPHLFPNSRAGILLYGPPGTGKTLVAKAVATECGLPFLSIKGPELLGSYVGESEANVREVFAQARECARQNQPPACVLFFDELDSLAPRRGENSSGGNVMDRVVATFFAELDKVDVVFCLGATNRPDLLDPSLLRPGRFDRLVYLGVTPSDRARILAAQIRKLRLEGDPRTLAEAVVQQLPENLTGADLSTVASGAQLLATERLCAEADAELACSEALTLDEVLESWDEERLTPIVTLEDLLKASETVVPSVRDSELERYERLRDQFRR